MIIRPEMATKKSDHIVCFVVINARVLDAVLAQQLKSKTQSIPHHCKPRGMLIVVFVDEIVIPTVIWWIDVDAFNTLSVGAVQDV